MVKLVGKEVGNIGYGLMGMFKAFAYSSLRKSRLTYTRLDMARDTTVARAVL